MLGMLQNVHYTLNTIVAYTLHTVANKCTSGCNRLCSPPENLALSWLSHSASILTHLNESVSRSSVGGGYHTQPFRWRSTTFAVQVLVAYSAYPETETHYLIFLVGLGSPKYNLSTISSTIHYLFVKNLKHLSSTLVLTHGSILTHLNETVSREMASYVHCVYTFVYLCLNTSG